MSRKRILVLGGGGFIGNHLVTALVKSNHWVRAIDLSGPSFSHSEADDFVYADLRNIRPDLMMGFDEIYQLAADMGGAGYLFTGANDAEVMRNSSQINTSVLAALKIAGWPQRLFYSSSACVYPEYNQKDPDGPVCSESTVYPAAPDSEYGWEKLFAERLYLAHARNYGCNIRIGRFHAIYGPGDDFEGGREKVISALCRKVYKDSILRVWGDGQQTRSFLFIDDLIEGLLALMRSDETRPTNIGSEELISINDLAQKIIDISGKPGLAIQNIPGPQGVRGRRSDNAQMFAATGWTPSVSLEDGLIETYDWIAEQLNHRS